ncbi:Zinc finger CCCH-type [Trinorchestia longiramus]|nr:Zinc finger CCCH-type [Trinorchestia longiramus]
MAEQELLSSIQLYNDQLSQVSGALASSRLGAGEKQQLEELQQNLMQLLELTLDQLQQQSTSLSVSEHPATITSHSKTEEEIGLEQELALFKSEIAQLDTGDLSEEKSESTSCATEDHCISKDSNLNSELLTGQNMEDKSDDEQLQVSFLLSRNTMMYKGFSKAWSAEEVRQLEGCYVCAPYTEEWGGHTYHNAVVMSVGDPDSGSLDLDTPEVVVLFSQPTSLPMLPCRYFLSGVCRFNDSCQYSHGTSVPVHLLKPYTVLDSSSLKVGSRILCRHSSSFETRDSAQLLWHPGVVDAILREEELVSVQCTPCCTVVECRLDQTVLLPNDSLHSIEYLSPGGVEIELSKHGGDSEDRREPVSSAQLELPDSDTSSSQWLLGSHSSALGDWEKHTKGIGSKLMLLMGYVAGTGLGRHQEGRVEPVPAYLYPPGVSLDRCMELRERSGGEDVLQVEKRLKKEQLKEEKRIKREEERIAANTSVFDIINNQLAGPCSKKDRSSKETGSVNVDKTHLKSNSSKELNMKGYHLSQRSSQLEREITRLTESMTRQAPRDKEAAQSIHQRIEEKRRELDMTNRAQARVSSEQESRREKKKYVVF